MYAILKRLPYNLTIFPHKYYYYQFAFKYSNTYMKNYKHNYKV